MAGTREPYAYIPYFFSDLFDWGYEAVGLTDSRLEMVIDWHKQNDTGVIYYVKDRVIQGVLLCNIWGKVDAARVLIEQKQMIVQNEPSSYRL